MKTTAFELALLISTTAFAQIDVVPENQAWEGDGSLTTAFETEGGAGGAYLASDLPGMTALPALAQIVQPSNASPERDARGIAVISAAAVAPAGWNGTAAGAAMGGPELDPVTGEAMAPERYPACTASVTDRCLQTYERGRR